MSVLYEDRSILMPFLDLPPDDETPLAKGKITGTEIRCFLPSSVPRGSHSKHMQTLWQVHLHGSFLVGLTPGKRSCCLWSRPTSLELCPYHDEKLTGATSSFQGPPLQKLAWLGPRRPSTKQSSYPWGAAHPFIAKSREHARSSWHPEESAPPPPPPHTAL